MKMKKYAFILSLAILFVFAIFVGHVNKEANARTIDNNPEEWGWELSPNGEANHWINEEGQEFIVTPEQVLPVF